MHLVLKRLNDWLLRCCMASIDQQ